MTLVLQALRGDQALDLGGLGVRLLALALGLDLTANDVFPDIVLLGQAEELLDLAGTLGTQALGVDNVGQTGDVGLALLGNGQSQDGQVSADNAAADRLALALAGPAGAVAGVALSQQETDTGGLQDTLLHGETLLVVATGDADNVALPLVTESVGGDLGTHLYKVSLSFLCVCLCFVEIECTPSDVDSV